MPNQPKTPIRGFRIPDELYRAAQAKAADEGRTLTDVVREFLENYIHGCAVADPGQRTAG
jgi:predicted DNA-binding protein